MTMTMERPIVNSLFTNQDNVGLINLFAPTIERLTGLDYVGWRAQLAADGFTDDRVEELESLLQDWTGRIDRDSLAQALMALQDIRDEDGHERVATEWLEAIAAGSVAEAIVLADFPDPLDALCYAVSRLGHIIYAAISFEFARRQIIEEPMRDLTMTTDQIAEGVALAEAGLEEDSKVWPRY